MKKAPEVSVSIRRTAVACAVEVIQRSGIWGIGGVVVEVCGCLVLKQETLRATGSFGVKAHRHSATWLPVGEGTLWVAVPLELACRSVKLVEKTHEDLATNCRI